METKNTNNENDDEKTIIYSNSGKVSNNKLSDKTTISNEADKTQIQDSPPTATEKVELPKSETVEGTSATGNRSVPKKDNRFSTGGFVVGVGSAGIAGAAIGTVFSDDIKEVYVTVSDEVHDFFGTEVQEVSPVINDGSSVETHASNVDIIIPESSSFEISSTDSSGNTYSVSYVDLDDDGSIEIQSGEIQLIDGSSIGFTETGENLSPLFAETTELATSQDYQYLSELSNLNGQDNFFNTEPATQSYQIQAGDTLSEIAAANNTSIEHLMELNPEILDPNLIYANAELIIPIGDQISNPYEIGNDFATSTEFFAETPDATIYEEVMTGEFAPVDWGTFIDSPFNNEGSNYGSLLAQTDFDGLHSPDTYLDNSIYEYGNDSVSAEFI